MRRSSVGPLTRRQVLGRLGGAGGLLLAACDPQLNPLGPVATPLTAQPAPVPTAAPRVTITQWFNVAGSQGDHATGMGEQFGQTQGRVDVKTVVVPQTEMASALTAALAAGEAPEVVHAGNAPLNALLIDGGLTEALDQWDPQISSYDWLPAAQRALSREGKLMACPASTGVLGLIYNKDLYEQAGLDPERPPETLDELAAAAGRVARPEQGVWGHYVGLGPAGWTADSIFVAYLWAFGGDVVNDDGTQVTFNSPEGVAALQYYADLAERQAFPLKEVDAPVMSQDFEAGTVGSITLYPVWVTRLERAPHRTGTARFPRGAGGAAGDVPLGMTASSILQQGTRKDLAWAYVQWLMQPDNHLAWVTGFGNLPARLSYRRHPAWAQFEAAHPLLRPYTEAQARAQNPFYGPGAGPVWSSLAQAIDGAVRGGVPVKQALDAAAWQAQDALHQAHLSRTLLTWFR